MHSWHDISGTSRTLKTSTRRGRPARRMAAQLSAPQALEERAVMDATPLPVLLVIADQRDFYYKEYGDTRAGLEAQGVSVRVAATTTTPSLPHVNTGEPAGTNGSVTPDIALANVNPDDYSAIVFVGGWGASMYQYAFTGDYVENRYDGNAATKAVVNNLINEFVQDDKVVAGVCHGVTVLAWARVDGVSPISGKTVSVPWIGSPAVSWNGQYYGYNQLSQYQQAVANGATANTRSGVYGNPNTVADDVVVDGRIITAENFDSALAFGQRIATEVIAIAEANQPAEPETPTEPTTPTEPVNQDPPADPAPPSEPTTPAPATPLPVLLVIADQNDFYYQEYGDTKAALESRGLTVRVAATTTNTSYPHANTGEPAGTNGAVTPDLRLDQVDPSDYSAIAFVGGWGASMYQYAFNGNYVDDRYDGDAATKAVVNELINEFIDQDKVVAAVCHGTTILAWARVDGVSPLAGKTVAVPIGGGPAVNYNAQYYGYFQLEAYQHAIWNGASPNMTSGIYGDPTTDTDDVVVSGRIITAENNHTAYAFGLAIATELAGSTTPTDPPVDPPAEPEPPPPPVNHAPTLADASFTIAENGANGLIIGTLVGSDVDAGQTLTYEIVGGNAGNAFSIDAVTGQLRVAQSAMLDFETTPSFQLTVRVTDSATPALSTNATVTVQLTDIVELTGTFTVTGGNLYVQGTSGNDWIYVWSNPAGQSFAWMNGQQSGPVSLPANGRVIVRAGAGDDNVFATDSTRGVAIHGEGGHDLITGGSGDDFLEGGDGVDRISAMGGNDILFGNAMNDQLDGGEGHDMIVGGDGDDMIRGMAGNDLLIGGNGYDRIDGGDGEDLLIGGRTTYDSSIGALAAVMASWRGAGTVAQRSAAVASGPFALHYGTSILEDNAYDCLLGGNGVDLFFANLSDYTNCTGADPSDIINRG